MENEKVTKTVKAKLYNLKSGVDGIMQLFESGVISATDVGAAVMSLSVKMVDELTEFFQHQPESPDY